MSKTEPFPSSPKIKKLLRILSDGQLHSGADIGNSLGITRAGVWKLIHQIKEQMDIDIKSKTNQGYCFSKKMELLSLQKIKRHLATHYHSYLKKTLIFHSIPSTNTYLLEQIQHKNEGLQICLAEMQSAGRGTFNRRWLSPFGDNVYLSLLWDFSGSFPQLSGLSLVVAVAVLRALKKCGVMDVINIKWPNDLLWRGRKLGGILIDLHGAFNSQYYVVIGIGLNAFISDTLRKSVDFSMADLTEIGALPGRNQLHAALIENLLDALAVFQTSGFASFMHEFQLADCLCDKTIQVTVGEQVFQGIARGIDHEGHLLLENNAGVIRRLYSGEASLHGMKFS